MFPKSVSGSGDQIALGIAAASITHSVIMLAVVMGDYQVEEMVEQDPFT
jgi:hypothetical protein